MQSLALVAASLLSPFFVEVTPEVRSSYVSIGKLMEDRPMQITNVRAAIRHKCSLLRKRGAVERTILGIRRAEEREHPADLRGGEERTERHVSSQPFR